MLVHALAAYADTYLTDQLADKAFEERPVPYSIQLYEDGTFAGIRERTKEVTRGKKNVRDPLPLKVPKSPVARNNPNHIHPLLGCDAISYVLGVYVYVEEDGRKKGWTKDNEVEKHNKHYKAFIGLMKKAAHETQYQSLKTCSKFYEQLDEINKAKEKLAMLKPRPGSLVTLAVVPRDPASENPGGPVIEHSNVRDYWRKHYEEKFSERIEKGGKGMCLISGNIGPFAPTHDKIMGTAKLGGQSSGVSLISFDKDAYQSYGWDKNANSPVSPDRATAYVLALNDLLKPGQHRCGSSRDKIVSTRFDAGGVAFLYWTRVPSDDDMDALFNQAQPKMVKRLLSAPFFGRADADTDPNDFYLAAVSGNGGRLLVRYWFRDKLSNVRANIRAWFVDQRIPDVFKNGSLSDPEPMWKILLAVSPPRVKTDNKINAKRSVMLIRRALYGLPLDRTILAAALTRLHVETGDARMSPVRVGLIRMSVNDIEKVEMKGGPIMKERLEEDLDHPAYVCGRLLAVYDRLQYAAQKEVSVTVADRYCNMASTYPVLAFPKLESLSKAHLKKLRRDNPGAAVNIEKQINALMEKLAGKFPSQLSMENQGRFVIGYHHQKAEDARKSAEMKAEKEARLESMASE
ncbi:MAG TPA: type I-C CRISPR-associated protein Cas8c/Csd1 [Thermoanaerobaculia bacterium]|nr:type I-C CRISPR-associated protein Cas8c/Csd1 [Thermoanaerobaculia bacterium]HUM30071.1 type I-C CRISPR-associated protein Cas8c/Csd1 [Thermoanaerobaculia bacterium]HXK69433.1 type I-C CRISPR-associated protein Cas8c/Csd1 [Thermoanaerobaculia bacterium]